MKKVYVALGIPSEYQEWCWLLSPLRWEKGGLPSREKIKPIKAETLACLIAVVEPTVNKGGNKRSSLSTQEMLAKKKHVIDLTFSKGKNDRVARSKLVMPAMPKVTSTIANRIAQHRGFIVPSLRKFMPRRPLGAKFGSPMERLATMKSDKVDSVAKVVPKPLFLLLRLIRLLRKRKLLSCLTLSFARKDFETFSISPEDLLAFTFEASIGEVVRKVGAQARRPSSRRMSKLMKSSLLGSL
ncbi:hypothetical protein D8674_010475 [Pyrus ussuriensis x Pyrus communis]|uniref:Uncharacterized protein n=1 Tax=Pyrus ussuriensis x Pyrus communis TaxID=2448454 RepID=A0A5N5FPL3_9ROSA|nr:hypothetical protein D8674_010475 [Pyrus ussuriensis x Pyrus communis]